ncbi:hypothetical protein SCE1572_11800 [Sorangium cellulosum So0157-2]|uniref:Uncharacterized protein n=1 Tax=Sorangium cellulosum So0157-2 TaxID=1254432 RepID=S4XRI8_SORCE|nr:hypothetical protein SCE1572_11800 [Sorangium cellulosum So0157-2]
MSFMLGSRLGLGSEGRASELKGATMFGALIEQPDTVTKIPMYEASDVGC